MKSFKFFQRYFCQMNHRTWNGRGNNELTPKQNIVITTPINLCMIILFIKKFEKPSDDVCLRCRYRSCIIRELFNKSSFILLLNLFWLFVYTFIQISPQIYSVWDNLDDKRLNPLNHTAIPENISLEIYRTLS